MASKRSIEIDVLTDVSALRSISDEWSALADTTGVTPFSLPSFCIAWWETLGRGTLRVVTARRAGELVAVLPMHERDFAASSLKVGSVLRWIGHGFGNVGHMMVAAHVDEDAVAGAVWDALAEASFPRAALQLTEYRTDGAGLSALRRSTAWDVFLEMRSMIPVIEPGGRTPAELLGGSAKRKLRHTLSTARRKADDAGMGITVDDIATVDEFDKALAEIDEVFDIAEAHDAKMHMFAGELRPMTLQAVREGLDAGHVVLFVVRLGGRAVAFDLNIQVNDNLLGFVRRHDPSARDYSPGHLLMEHGLDYVHRHGIKTFDLGLGDSDYKRRWATDWYDAVIVTGGRKGHASSARALTGAVEAGYRAREELRRRLARRGDGTD